MSAPITRIGPPLDAPSLAQRIAAIQAEARDLADGQVDQLVASLEATATIAAEVLKARTLHLPGIVDTCRQLADQAAAAALHINALRNRG